MGAKPPPGPVTSIDFRGFSGPKGCRGPPPGKIKNLSPPPLDKFLNTPLPFIQGCNKGSDLRDNLRNL